MNDFHTVRFRKRGKEKEAVGFSPATTFGRAAVCLVFSAVLLLFGIWSVADTDRTVSETENRALARRPALTPEALFEKNYTADFETYYSDTFPLRDRFLALDRRLSGLLTGARGADDIVLVQKEEKDDFAGEDIDYYNEESGE